MRVQASRFPRFHCLLLSLESGTLLSPRKIVCVFAITRITSMAAPLPLDVFCTCGRSVILTVPFTALSQATQQTREMLPRRPTATSTAAFTWLSASGDLIRRQGLATSEQSEVWRSRHRCCEFADFGLSQNPTLSFCTPLHLLLRYGAMRNGMQYAIGVIAWHPDRLLEHTTSSLLVAFWIIRRHLI